MQLPTSSVENSGRVMLCPYSEDILHSKSSSQMNKARLKEKKKNKPLDNFLIPWMDERGEEERAVQVHHPSETQNLVCWWPTCQEGHTASPCAELPPHYHCPPSSGMKYFTGLESAISEEFRCLWTMVHNCSSIQLTPTVCFVPL